MHNGFLIGLGLGLVSAALFASAMTGPNIVQLLLLLAVPLPIFLAGLGWGWPAAAIAGLAGSVLAVLWAGPQVGIGFFAVEGLPAALLTYLALLSRPVPSDQESAPRFDWYPAGSLVLWAALIAGLLAVVSIFVLGGDMDALKASLRTALEKMVKTTLADNPAKDSFTPEEIDKLSAALVHVLPAASALSWMTSLLGNLWLAGRITLASGQLARPWPDLAAIDYPRGTGIALAATLLAATAGGMAGMAASGFAGALFVAYVLMGLAVIHYATRGKSWRPFALWALYVAFLVVNAGVGVVVALLGLAEPILKLRARANPPQQPGPST